MVAVASPLQELAAAAGAAEAFQLRAQFDLPGGKTLVSTIDGSRASGRWTCTLGLGEFLGNVTNWNSIPSLNAADDAIRQVVSMYPKAVLRPTSVAVSIQKGTTTGAKVQPLAVQAWHEAYGLPIPSTAELARMRKVARADKQAAADGTIALLKTGQSGVQQFNRRPALERAKTDLQDADLTRSDLRGVDFSGARLNGARLVDARLSKAYMGRCKCRDADFTGADLTGTYAEAGTFVRANFAWANLTNVNLSNSDLRGANFTDATLTDCLFYQAKFDENTRWPKRYKLPSWLVWKGTGLDPRLAPTEREKALPKPTDFAGFLDRLKKVADMSKLDKAMAMLKADRFRLFAKVQPDQLVGVVKSQSASDLVYSCRLTRDGKYACCTQNLNVCGGLRGSPCKHLLVLIVGLTKAGELDPGTAHEWTMASRGRKAELDKDVMTETFLQYKGAEAGEVDWRPTETIPEDFYAM